MKHSKAVLWSLVVLVLILGAALAALAVWAVTGSGGDEPPPVQGQPPAVGQPPAQGQPLRTPESEPPAVGQPAAMDEPPPPAGESQITLVADRTRLQAGECATLQWTAEGGFGAMLNGQPVARSGQQQVCPPETTAYVLGLDLGERMEEHQVVIAVEGGQPGREPQPPEPQPPEPQPPEPQPPEPQPPEPQPPEPQPQPPEPEPQPPAPPPPQPPAPTPQPPTPGVTIDFRADNTNLSAGSCTTLRWDVENASAVYLDGNGVVGHSSKQVCPSSTRTYNLSVQHNGGTENRAVTINVAGAPPAPTAAPTNADVRVTDLYPDHQPSGTVWVRITNNGPAALTGAAAQVACSGYSTEYVGGAQKDLGLLPWQVTLNLNAGQTQAFQTGVSIQTNKYWYQITCTLTALSFADPNTSNNGYSETIPPPP